MDKNAIKKYAVWARKELIARVTQKAEQYEITEKKTTPADADSIGGRVLTAAEKKQRQALIAKINQDGFEQVMEEVAYTWFNRFTALRFMEVNNYLPSHTRVFTNENGEFKPQILADAIQLNLEDLNMDKVFELKDANKTEELYKYLLITQCNALSGILPRMFQKIEDYTELLLPDYLLREGSIIERMIAEIPEDNFNVETEGGQIEIIGWLYQYYISEKHEEVIDSLYGKSVKKEDVPAATQLFTTDWVVRYLIDNAVGRYWIERNPESKLAESLTYFVVPKNGKIRYIDEKIIPQDVTVFDPCVGSGHFLIYAFDVLMKIYEEYGYTARDAALEIVKNNLFGLDIDGRAVQLAYFAVLMKARQYDRRFFSRRIQPNIYEIKESNNVDNMSIEYFCDKDAFLKKDVDSLLNVLIDAKEYGSILQIPKVNFKRINERFDQLHDEISIYNTYLLGDFERILRPAEVLCKKYSVVATNPPYLSRFDKKLKEYINKYYKAVSGDLFSVFMIRNFDFCKQYGFCGFMTPYVWMFIKTYEKLRNEIIANKAITTLIQMEYSAYEEATVPICTFVLQNSPSNINGIYLRLTNFRGGMNVQRERTIEALKREDCSYLYEADQKKFGNIPGSPIVYWISDQFLKAFTFPTVKDVAKSCIGMRTGDNARFLRYWFEVAEKKIGFGFKSAEAANISKKKWIPFHKGGDFRRWYGNLEYVVNWENDGYEIKENTRKVYPQLGDNLNWKITNEKLYFREGITWTAVSSAKTGFRRYYEGFIFSNAGQAIIADDSNLLDYLQGLLNCKVTVEILQMIAPTIRFESGEIGKIPVCVDEERYDKVISLSRENTNISKMDWDSYEFSWDYRGHPFIELAHEYRRNDEAITIESIFAEWKEITDSRFLKLKDNEEELNRLFIDIYGLQDELTPEVEDKDVTVRKADLGRDIRSFISYAVGCMFGRYSLDGPGLILAGQSFSEHFYEASAPQAGTGYAGAPGPYMSIGEFYYKKENGIAKCTYSPDKDNIIPICDDEYFEDDIVGRFVEFVKIVYGEDTLDENLQFIADAIGGKGQPKNVIRNYFLNDFYKDHCKIYQKRPIYWLFDSGKKNGFKALIYMHRYQPDTIARIRTDYVHEQQSRYRTAIADLEKRIDNAAAGERVKLNKELNKLQAQAEEIRVYEEKIHHLADQMISIDLDDGVKHNYAIFKDVLAKIK